MWLVSDNLLTEILGLLGLHTYSGGTSKDGYTYYDIRNSDGVVIFSLREDDFGTINNKLSVYYRKQKINKIKERINVECNN